MEVIKKNETLCVKSVVNTQEKHRFLFISDIHFDSKHCDKTTLKRILDEALQHNAGIFIIGDWFDAMGHNKDPRSLKGDIKDLHQRDAYFNSIVDESAEFLKPYAKNIILISKGNHEHSILKHHEIDILSMLVYKLNSETDSQINIGKYYGWIRFLFLVKTGAWRESRDCYYTHGSGGGAIMSMGSLKTKRRQAIIDADIFVSGHDHQSLFVPIGKYYITQQGVEKHKEVLHLQLGTFEETNAWARSKEFQPASKSGYWLEFQVRNKELHALEIRAK